MKIIIDDAAITRALDKRSALAVRRQIQEIRERWHGGARLYRLLRWAVGWSDKYATIRQCAARMLGIAAKNRKVLTIWSIDGLAEKLDSLLTRKDKQPK